ncbi:MAG: DsbA family oxidoreductase [Myxococcales bacterium]|nr:DsbA family oxidoreductase [Myxococcales bacterium]
MRVEIWSDLICPWCGLGQHRLNMALERFAHGDDVQVVHRSFLLDPRAPLGETESVRSMLQAKKGMSAAQVDAITRHVEELARAEGLQPYIVGDNQVGGTSLAHELAAWATEQGQGGAAWARLYRAYFGEARSIFDVPALVELAEDLELDPGAARDALTSRRYADQVRADHREAVELGATGVPFIVVDRRYAIPGAQPTEAMLRTLEAAWRDRAPATTPTAAEGAVCRPDGCD